MSGRLNPRDYDLGELRDAVQETPRDHAAEEFTAESSRMSSETEHAVAVEPAKATENNKTDETATDDVERYLRSCHRRQKRATEQRRSDRNTGHEHRRPDRPKQQHAQPPDTFLAELSGTNLTKPYLERLPDAYSAQLEVFEWLDELLSRAGEEATVSALEYYEDIGWLSEESREELENITAGLSTPSTIEQRLDIDDHRESLLYVVRLSHRLNE